MLYLYYTRAACPWFTAPRQTPIKWQRTPACHAGGRGIQSSHADLPSIV